MSGTPAGNRHIFFSARMVRESDPWRRLSIAYDYLRAALKDQPADGSDERVNAVVEQITALTVRIEGGKS